MIQQGEFVALIFVDHAEPRVWTDEEVALVREVAERTRTAVERRRAEAELRESEARYRTLFEAIDSGFCIIEMIFDEDRRATDYRIVEANPAFERQSGLVDAVGRRIREFAPDLEAHWFEHYGRVALTGEPMRIEGEVAALERWYDINAFRVGALKQHRVAVLFTDVTARRRAEERKEFLLNLGDALRTEPNADAIVGRAVRMLAEELGLDRCYATAMYPAEDRVDVIREFRRPDLTPMPSPLRFSDFPEAGKQTFDRTLIFNDTANDPELTDTDKSSLAAMNFGALLSSALRQGTGNPIWALGAVSSQPRRWTPDEVALMEAATERTWAAVERARAEATLRESEERRELALEAAGMATFVWHVEEDRGDPDARMLALFGQPPDGGLNLKDALATMIHPDDAVLYAASVAEAVRPSGSRELREAIRVKRTGGGWRWVAMTGKVSFDSTGRPLRMAGTALDITERKLAELALRESEERKAFLLHLSDVLRPLTDPDMILGETNRMLAERLGVNRAYYVDVDEASGTGRIERDYVRKNAPSLSGEHRIADFAWSATILRRGECHVIADTQASPLVPPEERPTAAALEIIASIGVPLIKQGRLIGALCVTDAEPREWSEDEVDLVREVADRLWPCVFRARAEQALRNLNETLEQQVEERTAERDRMWATSPDLLLVIDFEGVFRRVNPAWTTVLGYGPEELVGRHVNEFVVPDDHAETTDAYELAASGGLPTIVNRYRHKDGAIRWISWTAAPADGVTYATGRDITLEKEREAELAQAQEALRQSQKMEAMGSLTGGVAHDFNNLLTPIIGSLDMLVRKGVGSERERRLIDGALQSAERAKTLVQRLLAFARRQPLQPVAVDVGRLVDGMAGLISSTLGPTIDVRVDVAPDLPAAKADLNQLEMALLNLAVNARDAMPDGGELTIAAKRESVRGAHKSGVKPGHYVRLRVADSGVGMDQVTLARAVEPFFSTKGIGKGTGLGLSMVHGLVAQLGGGLTIESEPGQGTSIELSLPISATVVGDDGGTAQEPSARVGRGTALLVDDEELVRMSTADMLIDLGFEVVEAGSAEEALQLMKGGVAPDLLVTDHLMPGMNGADLAKEVRVLKPALAVLVVSGYAEVEGIAPEWPRLTKPFRNAELAASLAALMPAIGAR